MPLKFHQCITLTKRHRKLTSRMRGGDFLGLSSTTLASFNSMPQQTGESQENYLRPMIRTFIYGSHSHISARMIKKFCYCFCFPCRELLCSGLILRRKQNFLISLLEDIVSHSTPFPGGSLCFCVLHAKR